MDDELKRFESVLSSTENKLKEDLRAIRSSRPSVDSLAGVKVNFYNDVMTIQQLGSLAVNPPREILISVWDKNAIGAVAKAVEDSGLGFSSAVDGSTIRAVLPQLTDERRAEFEKSVKKMTEGVRIQVRSHRDEVMKELKNQKDEGLINEDQLFKLKEQVQKIVDAVNNRIEKLLEEKIRELHE